MQVEAEPQVGVSDAVVGATSALEQGSVILSNLCGQFIQSAAMY